MDMSIGFTLVLVGSIGLGLLAWALVKGGSHPDTSEEDEEQAKAVKKSERIGLYNWNGTPAEGDYYVLVDLTEDQRQAL